MKKYGIALMVLLCALLVMAETSEAGKSRKKSEGRFVLSVCNFDVENQPVVGVVPGNKKFIVTKIIWELVGVQGVDPSFSYRVRLRRQEGPLASLNDEIRHRFFTVIGQARGGERDERWEIPVGQKLYLSCSNKGQNDHVWIAVAGYFK